MTASAINCTGNEIAILDFAIDCTKTHPQTKGEKWLLKTHAGTSMPGFSRN